MPKSPHPGHQSLWTSVAKSEGFRTCSSATGQHRPLGGLSLPHGPEGLVELRVRHRPAVVLQDEVRHRDPRVLADDAGELGAEIHLHRDAAPRLREEREHLRARERAHQANMQVADLRALGPQAIEGVEEGPFRRAPRHDDGPRVLRAEIRELHILRDLLRGQVELRESLLHHRVAEAGILGDVAHLVVLVPGVPEDRPLLAEQRARRHRSGSEAEPPVGIVLAVAVFPVRHEPLVDSEVEGWPIASMIRENPGPDVAVADRAPVRAGPVAIVTAAISSSVCTTSMEAAWSFGVSASGTSPWPSRSRISFSSRNSLSSEAGVIG